MIVSPDLGLSLLFRYCLSDFCFHPIGAAEHTYGLAFTKACVVLLYRSYHHSSHQPRLQKLRPWPLDCSVFCYARHAPKATTGNQQRLHLSIINICEVEKTSPLVTSISELLQEVYYHNYIYVSKCDLFEVDIDWTEVNNPSTSPARGRGHLERARIGRDEPALHRRG